MNDVEYLKNLSYELRWRKLPETEIVQVLSEVKSECEASELSPNSLFGPVDEYASTFSKGKSASLGFWIISISVVLAVLMIGTRVIVRLVTWAPANLLLSVSVVVCAVLIVVVGSVVAGVLDHRLPTGFK